jgi:hypothetical protein
MPCNASKRFDNDMPSHHNIFHKTFIRHCNHNRIQSSIRISILFETVRPVMSRHFHHFVIMTLNMRLNHPAKFGLIQRCPFCCCSCNERQPSRTCDGVGSSSTRTRPVRQPRRYRPWGGTGLAADGGTVAVAASAFHRSLWRPHVWQCTQGLVLDAGWMPTPFANDGGR